MITPVLVMVMLPVAAGVTVMPVAAVALVTTWVLENAVFWNVPSWKVMPRLPVPPEIALGKLTPLALKPVVVLITLEPVGVSCMLA